MYRTFNHYQLIGEWACPDFGETFKYEGIKHLKRIGKLANRRNQAEVQSGIMAAEQKKYRRTWHTDLSFLFAGALLEGSKANLTFRSCSVCPLQFVLPPKSSLQMSWAKMLLPECKDREQKVPEWTLSVVHLPECAQGHVFSNAKLCCPSFCPSLSLPPCWMLPVLWRFFVLFFLVTGFWMTSFLILDHLLCFVFFFFLQ